MATDPLFPARGRRFERPGGRPVGGHHARAHAEGAGGAERGHFCQCPGSHCGAGRRRAAGSCESRLDPPHRVFRPQRHRSHPGHGVRCPDLPRHDHLCQLLAGHHVPDALDRRVASAPQRRHQPTHLGQSERAGCRLWAIRGLPGGVHRHVGTGALESLAGGASEPARGAGAVPNPGARRGPPGSRIGQSGQVGLHGGHQPRTSHTAQCHSGHVAPDAANPAGDDPARVRPAHQPGGPAVAGSRR